MNTILLQAAGGSSAMISQVILMVGIFGVFYLFILRPQQKKQKDQKKFLENIKKGDEVITISGLHGKVSSISDTTITLEVDNKGTKLTFDRVSIARTAAQPAA